jgi:hypothetical protein
MKFSTKCAASAFARSRFTAHDRTCVRNHVSRGLGGIEGLDAAVRPRTYHPIVTVDSIRTAAEGISVVHEDIAAYTVYEGYRTCGRGGPGVLPRLWISSNESLTTRLLRTDQPGTSPWKCEGNGTRRAADGEAIHEHGQRKSAYGSVGGQRRRAPVSATRWITKLEART